MALALKISDAEQIDDGTWRVLVPPHQVQQFASSPRTIGERSVIMLTSWTFNPGLKELSFPLDAAVALNVGTTSKTIVLTARNDTSNDQTENGDNAILGMGDRSFLALSKAELTADMAKAAEDLLLRVRERSPGDLKRGKSRNFSETPDNFWYVIVQNRINQLSITVRGPVSHFEGVANLQIKDDRGNTRFKVQSPQDLDDALKLIMHAIRKS
jgi:hypothetical protein